MLIDALEMMKQGVKCLLVPKSVVWKGVSKKFSILYNGKWLRNIETGNSNTSLAALNRSSSSTTSVSKAKYCCLSREDVIQFLIGCLGALAPIPLSTISTLGAINRHYSSIEAHLSAVEATKMLPHDPCAVAIVEPSFEGPHKIIREISVCKLWKCDYVAAAYALANLSARQFVMGVEDNMSPRSVPNIGANSANKGDNTTNNGSGSMKLRRFSSRSIGFFGNAISPTPGSGRSMYRGRSAPLMCKETKLISCSYGSNALSPGNPCLGNRGGR